MKIIGKKRVYGIFVLFLILLMSIVWAQPIKQIDLNFKNTEIKDVLRTLADQQGVNLIVDDNIKGPITVRLSKVTFKEALDLITKNNSLIYTYENRSYHVSRANNYLLKIEYQNNLLTIEAKEAPFTEILEQVASKSGLNFIPDKDLNEQVTLSFKNSPLEEGLQVLLAKAECISEKQGNVILIHKRTLDQIPVNLTCKNKLLTLDARNVPLIALTRALTEKTGVSVVPDQNLNPSLSIYFKDLTLEDCLNVLADTANLAITKEGEIWRISAKSGKNNFRIKYQNSLLTANIDNADASTVTSEIMRQTGCNIMLAKEINGNVNAHFQDVPLFQALIIIYESQGWSIEKQDNYYYVRYNNNANPNMRVIYNPETENFDLDIQSASIAAVLSEMARKANQNIVVFSQVNWTVNNIRLQKVNFTKALDYLLRGTVFTYRFENETYLVGDGMIVRPENSDFCEVKVYSVQYLKAEQLLNTLPPIFSRQNFMLLSEKNALIVSAPPNTQVQFAKYLAQVDVEGINDRTEVFKIKYLKAEDVLKLFPPTIPKNDIVVIKEANALAVTGPQNLVSQVKQYIEKIDQVNPMIIFDIMIVSLGNSKGIDWDPSTVMNLANGSKLEFKPGTGEVSLQLGAATESIYSTLKILGQQGKAKIVQNPTLSTLNGYKVSFNVNNERNYKITTVNGSGTAATTTESVKTFTTGLQITITPWVSSDNQITMELKPEFSEFGAVTEGLPEIIKRTSESTIRVGNKQTIVISGLRNVRTVKKTEKIPLLGDIPLLGKLFSKVKNDDVEDEYLLVMTPYLAFNETDRLEIEKMIKERFSKEMKQESRVFDSKPTQNAKTSATPKVTPVPTPTLVHSLVKK